MTGSDGGDFGGFGGPGLALQDRVTIASASPLWIDLDAGPDYSTIDHIHRAVRAVKTFDQLPSDVQDWIVRGEAQVSAGLAPWLILPAGYFDWQAEDAALDAAVDPESKGFDFDEPNDDELAAPDLPTADDDGWVGV